jgi:hypothetical protein
MGTLTTLNFVNPGFETADLTGWSYDSGFVAATTSFDDLPNTGSYMAAKGPFGGTPGVTAGSLWQVFNLSAYASHIDAGAVSTGGWSVQHSERDDQVDNGGMFMSAYANSDGTGTLLGNWFVLAPNHSPRPGWETLAMSGKAVPAATRSLVLGVTSTWFFGGTNDNQWDDFVGPTLETTLPIGTTFDLILAIAGAAMVSIGAPTEGSPSAPVVIHNLGLTLRSELRLGLAGEKFPLFGCAPPPVKNWAREAPSGPAWTCHLPAAPEACDGGQGAADDDLILTLGERLTTLAGDGLKLAS